jgi:ABC-2 type transport system ATP-binding protein
VQVGTPIATATAPPRDFLDVVGLRKSFNGRTVLFDVSFRIARGEIIGFVGPNGAGKSTTMKIMCGLLRPEAGTVQLDGVDLRKEPCKFLSQIGALIESPAFYPSLSAFDHVAYFARLRGCYSHALVCSTLERVGLAPLSKKKVGEFSTGMKQRLGIALAVLHSPRFLLLDEPMNGLDPVGMVSMRELVRALSRENGVAVLVSSHLLHEVEQVCDRVLFIKDGRLVREKRLSGAVPGQTTHVRLRTGDNARAAELLREAGFVHELKETAGRLEGVAAEAELARIPALLVGEDIELYEFTPTRESLESVYISEYGADNKRMIE